MIGARPVIMMTDVEAMPPITAFVAPPTSIVFTTVWDGSSLSISNDSKEVSAVAVKPRNAEVTRRSIRMVKLIKRKKPVFPRVVLAISATDLPFSLMLVKSVVIS